MDINCQIFVAIYLLLRLDFFFPYKNNIFPFSICHLREIFSMPYGTPTHPSSPLHLHTSLNGPQIKYGTPHPLHTHLHTNLPPPPPPPTHTSLNGPQVKLVRQTSIRFFEQLTGRLASAIQQLHVR